MYLWSKTTVQLTCLLQQVNGDWVNILLFIQHKWTTSVHFDNQSYIRNPNLVIKFQNLQVYVSILTFHYLYANSIHRVINWVLLSNFITCVNKEGNTLNMIHLLHQYQYRVINNIGGQKIISPYFASSIIQLKIKTNTWLYMSPLISLLFE